jgi:hypothetical protein
LGLYVGSIVFAGALMGFFGAPRRALEAWRAAPGRGSLFQTTRPYEDLLAMTVGELRAELGVPDRGVATTPGGLHAYAPRQVVAAPAE